MEMEAKPQQIAIPFHDGVLRCDVTESGLCMIVRTFVPEPAKREAALSVELSKRIFEIDDAAFSTIMWSPWAIEAIREPRPHRLAVGTMAVLTHGRTKLRPTLYAHDWIFEPYVERPDPIGDMWAAANESRMRMQGASTA
jgi:hypothetical protein